MNPQYLFEPSSPNNLSNYMLNNISNDMWQHSSMDVNKAVSKKETL
jgi:hypothetical protein